MSRFTKSVAAVARAPYTVVSEIWHGFQRVEAGTKIMLSATEAKYHLLAGRIVSAVETVEADVAAVLPKSKKAVAADPAPAAEPASPAASA